MRKIILLSAAALSACAAAFVIFKYKDQIKEQAVKIRDYCGLKMKEISDDEEPIIATSEEDFE